MILWSVHGSEMAQTDNKGARIPHGIQCRGRRRHPDKLGYLQETWGWWEEMVTQFTVYAKSNARANELVSWFHRMMMVYTFGYRFFQARGVSFLKFEGRQPDEKTQDFGQELYVRKLRYRVRISLQDVYDSKTLEDVVINVGMRPGGQVASFEVNHDGQ